MSAGAPHGRSPLPMLALFALGAVAVAGLLSPWLLRALHAVGAREAGLEEVTVRTLELVAIAATFALLRVLGAGGAAAWGVPPRRALVRDLSAGLALGIASLGLVCVTLLLLDVRVLRPDLELAPGFWLRVLSRAALSAAAVAVLEELWFRGGLYTVLERVGGAGIALWGGAALYAGAHFLDAPDGAAGTGWGAGFAILGQAGAAVFQARNVDSFVALLLAGAALALVRQRRGHVALCIGIHAGWVLAIKLFKKLTHISPEAPLRTLAGHYDDVIGWLAAAVLGALLLALARWLPPAGTARP